MCIVPSQLVIDFDIGQPSETLLTASRRRSEPTSAAPVRQIVVNIPLMKPDLIPSQWKGLHVKLS